MFQHPGENYDINGAIRKATLFERFSPDFNSRMLLSMLCKRIRGLNPNRGPAFISCYPKQLAPTRADVEDAALSSRYLFCPPKSRQRPIRFILCVVMLEVVSRLQLIVLRNSIHRHRHRVWKHEGALSAAPALAFNSQRRAVGRTAAPSDNSLSVVTRKWDRPGESSDSPRSLETGPPPNHVIS